MELQYRLDNPSSLMEAQKIFEREKFALSQWYRKQLILFGSGPHKLIDETTQLLTETINDIALTYGIEANLLRAKTRRTEIVMLRHAAMYTLVHKFKFSRKSVGRALGGRDHTTVISALKNVENWIERDYYFTAEIANLEMIYADRPKKKAK